MVKLIVLYTRPVVTVLFFFFKNGVMIPVLAAGTRKCRPALRATQTGEASEGDDGAGERSRVRTPRGQTERVTRAQTLPTGVGSHQRRDTSQERGLPWTLCDYW